mmetsp:Transcript_9116/g.21447  ORF Transcript_9116/g.21447 Transcript_9116/m.21447 type:complete len:871 (-) Transcript_9116:957-3569(-)
MDEGRVQLGRTVALLDLMRLAARDALDGRLLLRAVLLLEQRVQQAVDAVDQVGDLCVRVHRRHAERLAHVLQARERGLAQPLHGLGRLLFVLPREVVLREGLLLLAHLAEVHARRLRLVARLLELVQHPVRQLQQLAVAHVRGRAHGHHLLFEVLLVLELFEELLRLVDARPLLYHRLPLLPLGDQLHLRLRVGPLERLAVVGLLAPPRLLGLVLLVDLGEHHLLGGPRQLLLRDLAQVLELTVPVRVEVVLQQVRLLDGLLHLLLRRARHVRLELLGAEARAALLDEARVEAELCLELVDQRLRVRRMALAHEVDGHVVLVKLLPVAGVLLGLVDLGQDHVAFLLEHGRAEVHLLHVAQLVCQLDDGALHRRPLLLELVELVPVVRDLGAQAEHLLLPLLLDHVLIHAGVVLRARQRLCVRALGEDLRLEARQPLLGEPAARRGHRRLLGQRLDRDFVRVHLADLGAGVALVLRLAVLDPLLEVRAAVRERDPRELDPHPPVVEVGRAHGDLLIGRRGRFHRGLAVPLELKNGLAEHRAALVVRVEVGDAERLEVLVRDGRVYELGHVGLLLDGEGRELEHEVGHLEDHLGELLGARVVHELVLVARAHVLLHNVVARARRLVTAHGVVELSRHELADGQLRVVAVRQRGPERHELVLVLGRPPEPEHLDRDQRALQLGPRARDFEVVRQRVELTVARLQAAKVARHEQVEPDVEVGRPDVLQVDRALVVFVREHAEAVHAHGEVFEDPLDADLGLLRDLGPHGHLHRTPDLLVAQAVARRVEHRQDTAENPFALTAALNVIRAEVEDLRDQVCGRARRKVEVDLLVNRHGRHLDAQPKSVEDGAEEHGLRRGVGRRNPKALRRVDFEL